MPPGANLAFHDLAPSEENFRDAVLAGLGRTPKELPCKLFYDARGSTLFEQICETPEYYLTRTEIAILETHAKDIAAHIGPHCRLIELGSGASRKVRILLGALDRPAAYVPLDISRERLHEAADVCFPINPLVDGQELHLGQLVLRVVHTPGHRPESICLLVTNPPRSPMPSIILSGDTLFVGDVGRPDFGGPEGAQAQFNSIRRLLELEDYLEVFPAHFEGSCGKGMCGRPSTTIGFERRFNPVLQLSAGDFLKATAEVPARP